MAVSTETHILIIWSKALEIEPVIVQELQKEFLIKRIFDVHWEKNSFAENLKVFYSHSQKHLNEDEYHQLIQNKIDHCGDDAFKLIVFEDTNPLYENRSTSDGLRPVNKNIFDLKQSFRALSGGGHKIHTSDNVFESNKDLTLLLNKNCEDFYMENPGYSSESELLEYDCAGVGGFTDIHQLFYVLNNTIDYVVMRNFECLPDTFTVEGHGDIDLLVENVNYIKYLTGAKPVFPELDYRVHYTIQIGEKTVPFDFRFLGDNYYDFKWQIAILKNRQVFNKIIYVPDDVSHFYTLIYHAFVQKPEVNEDYHDKLSSIAKKIKIKYTKNLSLKEVKDILDDFLKRKNYQYSLPVDKTVYFNKLFLENDAARGALYGQRISASQSRFENQIFFSEVYEKENVITKIASKEVIENEIYFLNLLKSENYFPKLIRSKIYDDFGLIEMEKIDGIAFVNINEEYSFWTSNNIKGIITDGLLILKILNKNNIMHRDLRPENLILKKEKGKYKLKLIDFGWAIKTDVKEKFLSPHELGGLYKYKEGEFSDAWSLGKIIIDYFGIFSIGKKVIDNLQKIMPVDYENGNADIEINKVFNEYLEGKTKNNLKDTKWLLMQKSPFIKNLAFRLTKIKNTVLNNFFCYK